MRNIIVAEGISLFVLIKYGLNSFVTHVKLILIHQSFQFSTVKVTDDLGSISDSVNINYVCGILHQGLF